MDRSSLLSAWWMPEEEEKLWEAMHLITPQRIVFLTGIFVLFNSFCFSLARLLFERKDLTERDQVWIPHRLVECFYSAFVFLYCLTVFIGWEDDNTFLQGRVFIASGYQEFLSSIQSAYSVYSIGVAVVNFKTFGEKVRGYVMKGCLVMGMNYLNLLFPCVLGARLRTYWGLLEIATVFTTMIDFFKLRALTRMLLRVTMGSMLTTLARFWVASMLLFWGYNWLSAENVWSGIPSEVPVSELTHAYITGMAIGAVGWSYVAFADFREIVAMTKAWMEAHRTAERRLSHPHSR